MEEAYQDTHISNKMKAQIVKENLEFEKGKDPKETLGLGLKAEISAMRNQLSEHFDYSYPLTDDPYHAGVVDGLEHAIDLLDKLSIMKK
jgi:hypothetical protein